MRKYQEYYPHGIMFHRFHKHDQIGGSITANNLEDIINIIGIDRIISPSKWIQKCIDDKIVNYDHKADKSLEKKYNANYKLRVVDDKILPNYLVKNKNKFKEWFDN